MQGFRLYLLHVVEQAAFVSHALEYGLYILEGHHALANHVNDLRRGVGFALDLLEIALQLAVHIHAGLGKLTNFCSAQVCGGFDLSVSKDKAAHVNAKTRRHVGEAFGGVKELVGLSGVILDGVAVDAVIHSDAHRPGGGSQFAAADRIGGCCGLLVLEQGEDRPQESLGAGAHLVLYQGAEGQVDRGEGEHHDQDALEPLDAPVAAASGLTPFHGVVPPSAG